MKLSVTIDLEDIWGNECESLADQVRGAIADEVAKAIKAAVKSELKTRENELRLLVEASQKEAFALAVRSLTGGSK